jgi:TPR repeat protein
MYSVADLVRVCVLSLGVLACYINTCLAQAPSGASQLYDQCKLGNVRACLAGYDLEKNPFIRLEFAERACQIEVGPICTLAGAAYFFGEGARVQPEKARALFLVACDSGEPTACVFLGDMVRKEARTISDHRLALARYGKACDLKLQMGCDAFAKQQAFLERIARSQRDAEDAARVESERQNNRVTMCLAWSFANIGMPCPF